MNKLIVTLILMLLGLTSFSQNGQVTTTKGTAGNFHYKDGNVGIGTSTPVYSTVISNNGGTGLEIDPTGIQFTEGVGIHTYNRITNAYTPFQIYSSKLILNGGNVGIGTTEPSGLLTITTKHNGEILSIKGSYNNHPKIFEVSQNASDGMVFVRNALEQTIPKISGHKPVPTYFLSNVGIGSESPTGKLTIQTEGDGELFSIKGSYDNKPKLFEVTQKASDGMVYVRNALGQTISKISGYKPVPSYFISNVGIGTTTTGAHKLAVDGTIGAREIKVEATGWSDFVFNDNYNLKDLEEVESFINENNHLPDIPSEKEVLENGIQLGEMDAKLLQKIEELTLYMIEQNKMMKAQNKEIQNLKKEIKILKTQ